jgi:iron complex transport system substrate-binding protein
MCPKMGDTKPMVSSQLYNNNLRRSAKGGNDYWEGGIMHPDLILRDLIKIFHPEALPTDTLVYYRRLQ